MSALRNVAAKPFAYGDAGILILFIAVDEQDIVDAEPAGSGKEEQKRDERIEERVLILCENLAVT